MHPASPSPFAHAPLLGCSFSCVRYGSEEDMRFVFCACAISHILDDWSGIDGAAMSRFINSCLVRGVLTIAS